MQTRHRAKDEGRLRVHRSFHSRYLSTPRDLIVYTPCGYDGSTIRCPVLYLQDGQNLFDPATAYCHNDWRLDLVADDLIARNRIPPLLIAGIYNAGVRRVSEYTPTRSKSTGKGGKAERYAQMLAREVKPFIDRAYRTRKGAQDTGVGGSSLGALVSLTTGLHYPRVFGKMAILSPAVWWDARSILRSVEAYPGRAHPRIWLDTGTAEGDYPASVVEDARTLRDALIAKGWRDGETLRYLEDDGAGHNEHAWGARISWALEYLFG